MFSDIYGTYKSNMWIKSHQILMELNSEISKYINKINTIEGAKRISMLN